MAAAASAKPERLSGRVRTIISNEAVTEHTNDQCVGTGFAIRYLHRSHRFRGIRSGDSTGEIVELINAAGG